MFFRINALKEVRSQEETCLKFSQGKVKFTALFCKEELKSYLRKVFENYVG